MLSYGRDSAGLVSDLPDEEGDGLDGVISMKFEFLIAADVLE